MSNSIIDTALETGARIHNRWPNAQVVAEMLHAPPSLQSSATAGMLIAMGMAMSPPTTWRDKSTASARLQRHAATARRPRPLLNLASQLLRSIDTRGTNAIATALRQQAELCRRHMNESVAALEQLNPLRDRDSAYYSSGAASTLMAHLAVPEDLDWSDPDTMANLTMADYACGHGALLIAAYQRARELHSQAGGDPAGLHAHMMERCITATDITPAAVVLTAERLANLEPDRPFRHNRVARLPNGTDADGRHRRGALDLLIADQLPPEAIPLPLDAHAPNSQRLVLINPPYGRYLPGQSASLKAYTHVTKGARAPGPAPMLAHLALRNTAPGGHLAMILPLGVTTSPATSPAAQSGVTAWHSLRLQLLEQCANITVISTAHYSEEGNAFSHDTTIAEVMVVARKLRPGEQPTGNVSYVNLSVVPNDADEARDLAARIKSARRNMRPGDIHQLAPGPGPSGHIHQQQLDAQSPWNVGLFKKESRRRFP